MLNDIDSSSTWLLRHTKSVSEKSTPQKSDIGVSVVMGS